MNKYPLWKYLLIVVVTAVGLLYALPNLYGVQPAIQVSASTTSAEVSAVTLTRIQQTLKLNEVPYRTAVYEGQGIKVRFADTEDQLKARDLIQKQLGSSYSVALNLLPATPAWLQAFNAKPMYLGLDLRGGVHFLLQVDMQSVLDKAEQSYVDDIKNILRDDKIRYGSVKRLAGGVLQASFSSEDVRDQAYDKLRDELPELSLQRREQGKSYFISGGMSEQALQEKRRFALEQNMTSLRNRVNELGVAEPIIQQQGEDRIVVQLPGVQDTGDAKDLLGRTATLEFRMVDHENNGLNPDLSSVPFGAKIYYDKDKRPYLLKRRVIYSGDNIVDASPGFDSRSNQPIVSITLDAEGARVNQRVTGKNINKNMAAVFIEVRSEPKLDAAGNPVLDKDGKAVRIKKREEVVLTAPVIRAQLGKRFQIEGRFTVKEANELALLLRAGALAAPVDIIEERTIGPSLGKDNVDQGFRAILYGFAAVVLFMMLYYRAFGVIAVMALSLNLVLIVAALSLFQATLTLPGIAGILLTVGMAVDANVLIFERIREEVLNGNTPQASIYAGYAKALSTIADANITTLIAAIMLFNFGTGPIKGFAITLSIGILTSMFTAIIAARGVTNLAFGGRRMNKLPI